MSKSINNKLYNTLYLHNYHNNVNKNIPYSHIIFYITSFNIFIKKIYNLALQTKGQGYNNLCLNMLFEKYYSNNYLNNNFDKIIKSDNMTDGNQIFFFNFLKNIINQKDNNLLITNTFPIIDDLNNIKINFDIIMFENEEMDKEKFDIYLKKKLLTNNLIFQSIYNNDYNNDDNNKKKYNNIILKHNEFYNEIYFTLFELTKIPYKLFNILKSLKYLKDGGNLIILFRIIFINNAYEWIITLLSNLFENIEVNINKTKNETMEYNIIFFLHCQNFKGNNKENLKFNKIIDTILEDKSILKYNYTLCEFMTYYSTITHKNAKYFNNNFNIYPVDNSPSDKKFTPLKVIDTINIKLEKNIKAEFVIYQLKSFYETYIDKTNYNILNFISVNKKNNSLTIDKNFIEKIQYNKIINRINFYEENKIPYNKSYLVYINKYNKNLVSQIFTYKNIIDYKFLKYRGTSTKKYQNETLNKLKSDAQEDYHFEEFNKKQELLELSYKVKNNLLEENNIKKIPKIIKEASNGIINNLPDYLMDKYNLKNEIDISFCEMWEIYNSHNDLLPMKQNPKVFYLNDISGQSVYASNLYYKHHYSKKYPVGTYAIDMLAVAFNKNNLSVNQKYKEHLAKEDSVNILSKKDSKKVIYGADNTGDILFSNNQKWFIQYIKELTKKNDIDLIIADSTSSSNNPMITQRLEFATVCMIARTTGIDSNCIVKAQLPYNIDNSLTYSSSGFFVNYLFLYYLMFEEVKLIKPLSSSPNNSEFYIIGKKFRDIEEEHYEKLLNILDNFKYNICFFKKDDIPQEFINQVIDFTDKLLTINIDYNEINNLLLTCLFHKNSVIEEKTQCSKYLNPEYINDIQNEKIKEWIKDNKFLK